MAIEEQLLKAFDKRQSLASITNAMRVVNGFKDQCEGLCIDRYGTHAIIYVYQLTWFKHINAIKRTLIQAYQCTYIIVKDRSVSASSNAKDIHADVIEGKGDGTTTVKEHGLSFQVHVNDGLNAGLFLDMRANRHQLGLLCKNKKVLNCFAYTCAFGVHARRHGAREVVNVDLSKNYLQRGQANYALNHIAPGQGEFLCFDAVKFLANCVKKANLFDVIILDPPSFARVGTKTFQVKRDLAEVMALSITSLSPDGILFVSTNCSDISYEDLERMLAKSLNGRRVIKTQRLAQDIDFPGTNSVKESYLVGLVVHVR